MEVLIIAAAISIVPNVIIRWVYWRKWYWKGQDDANANWYWHGIATCAWWIRVPYNRGYRTHKAIR